MLIAVTKYLEHSNDFSHPDLASAVDELSLWSSRFGSLLLDNLEIQKGISLLDIGCANGFPLFELAHVFGGSSNLTGIDVWSAALKRARFKQRFYALPNVSLVEADAMSKFSLGVVKAELKFVSSAAVLFLIAVASWKSAAEAR